MLHFDSSHPIVTRGSRVSRAPPHHTLPTFLNLNGIISYLVLSIFKLNLLFSSIGTFQKWLETESWESQSQFSYILWK